MVDKKAATGSKNIREQVAEDSSLAQQLAQAKAELLAQLKDEAAKIIADAKAEAARQAAQIIAQAQEQADAGEHLPQAQDSEAEQWLNQYVTVELFKDNNKYKDDVYVSIGDENCLIQRGKPVQIKRKFALALDLSRLQQKAASQMQEDAARNSLW